MARGIHRLSVSVLLVLVAALGCQEHDLGTLDPDIVVDPEAVEFGTVTVGVPQERYLSVQNVGDGTLNVDAVVLADGTGPFAVEEFSGTVAPDGVVELVVSLEPTLLGTAQDVIEIYSDDPDEPVVEVPVSVLDVVEGPVPAIAWSPSQIDHGAVPSGGASSLLVTVTSVGTADLMLDAEELDGLTSDEYTITLDPAPLALAPSNSTQIEVTYAPVDEGVDDGVLLLTSNDPDVPLVEIPLTGELLPSPDIELVPTELLFGDVETGTMVTMEAEIWSLGDADLELGTLAVVGAAEFALHTAPSGVVLAPGEYTTVTVSYTPVDMTPDLGDIEIPSNDPDENPAYLSLAGQHEPIPDIEVTPLEIDFGPVDMGTVDSDVVLISNVGTGDLTVDLPLLTGSIDFAISASQFPTTIAPGTSEMVLVDYAPSDLTPDTGEIAIDSDDPDEPTVTVQLLGDATPAPDIDLLPTSLAFGQVLVGASATMAATIFNVGTADLELGSLAVVGTTEFTLTVDPSGAVLAPGGLTAVEVTYTPVDTVDDSAQVEIPSNDPDENPIYLDLLGEDEPVPDIDVDPLLLDLGSVPVGGINIQPVTVTNVGGADLDVTAVTLSGSAEFAVAIGSLPGILAPGASVSAQVSYQPVDQGGDTATLTFDSDDPDEPSVVVELVAECTPYPDIDVDPAAVDFGDVVILTTETAEVTIANVGDADLELYGCSYSGDPNFWISANPAGAVIPPGGEIAMEVSFQATAELAYLGEVDIASNDPLDPVVTVELFGGGIEPDIDLDPAQLDFGAVEVGVTATMDAEIWSLGSADLELGALSLVGGSEFQIVVDPSLQVIVPGDVTVITVSYTPTDMGGDSAYVEIPSNDPDENPVYLDLFGQHDPIPDIDVTPTSIWFSGIDVGQSGSDTVTVANVGTGDLWVDQPALTGSVEFAINAAAFPATIPPGGSLPIAVVYTPVDLANDYGEITITSDDPDEPTVVVPLTGDPTPVPDIEVIPTVLQFGQVQVGQSTALTASIGNVGIADLELGALTVNGTSEFSVSIDPSGQVLVPGATTVVEVTYAPVDAGADSALLEIPSNDPDENPVHVTLSGAEDPVPDIDVDPLHVDFGTVDIGQGTLETVTVSNVGGATLTVSSVSLSGSNDFGWSSANLPGTVAPGGSRTIIVSYSPGDEVADTGTLSIASDDPDEPTVTVSLEGAHTPYPDIDVDPPLVDFGDVAVGTVEIDWVTITNIGDADLDLTACSYAGDAVFWISSNPAGTVLSPGASVDLEISFEPDDELSYQGLVGIASNDPDDPVVQVDILGGGVAPDIDLQPSSLNFGSVPIGGSSSLDAEIWNVGGADLSLGSLTLVGSAEFVIDVDPSFQMIVPGDYTLVTVTYTPVDTQSDLGEVEIPSDDPDEPLVALQLAGAHEPEPDIDVDPLVVDFGTVDLGNTSTQVVTVSNVGSGDLQVGVPVLSGSPEFGLVTGSFPTVLAPGDARTFNVSYSPYDENADTATVTVASDDPDEPQVIVTLLGQATPEPDIDVSPLILQYGQVMIGQASALSATIQNLGSADLELGALSISGTSEYTVTVDPSGAVLGAGASTTVEITYAPVDVGADNATLSIPSNDPDEPIVPVVLNGADEPTPDIDVDPLWIDFGNVAVGQGAMETIHVSNVGTATLVVGGVSYSGSGDFTWMSASLPGSVAPGVTRTIVVTYTPSDQVPDVGTIRITSDDPDEPVVDVELNGAPEAEPDIDVDPPNVDFGDVKVGDSAAEIVTIYNDGAADLDLYSCTRGGDPNFSITANPAGTVVAPGGSTTLEVTFYPTAEATYGGWVDIASNDPDEAIVTVDLFGAGAEPEILITPSYWDFGNVVVECVDTVDIDIHSVGDAPLALYGYSFASDPELSFDPGDLDDYVNNGWELPPGDTITVTVEFVPTDVDTYAGLLSVQSDDPGQPVATADQVGDGVPSGYTQDNFVQTGNNEADVLWVVDNSCSMADEQGYLADDFSYFYSVISGAGVDYRIATVTTDDADFEGGTPVIDPATPNGANVFAANCTVGTTGSGTERGLMFGYNALTQAIANTPPNQNFWRQDAGLRVVYVSDEPDQSGNWSTYLSNYQNLKADPSHVILSAICGTNGYVAQNCSGPGGNATAGTGYVDVANATGGVLGSICEPDWSSVLTSLAWITVNLADTFELSLDAIESTIIVYVNGVVQASGWYYDANLNSVVFDPAYVPQDGDVVQIYYGYYGPC